MTLVTFALLKNNERTHQMPKQNDRMTKKQVKQARQIHKQVLNENKLLKRLVENNIKGLQGKAKQKAWAAQIRILFSRDLEYKAEIKRRFKQVGLPTLSADRT